MKRIFKSRITRLGPLLTPYVIEVDDNFVTFRKRNSYLLNVDSMSIPISKISSVNVDANILGTEIIITSFGEGEIRAKKFSLSDAKEIKQLIESLMN
jgi:hypothetical protein